MVESRNVSPASFLNYRRKKSIIYCYNRMFGIITELITISCCKLYPVFASFKAIRNRDGDEYSRWFIYWIMLSLFTSVTYLTDWVFWWVPFYEVLKLCISIWLLPFFRGSKILYTGLVHPQLMENELQIDMFVNSISNRLLTLGKVLFSFAIQKTTEVYAAQTLEAVTAMPTQQSIPPPGMQYPQQSADSYPPTYSDVIDTESTKQKEFSDEEDFRKTANPIDLTGSDEPSEPRMREKRKQTDRPKSEAVQSNLSRQKSPQYKATRTQSQANVAPVSDKKRSSTRQQSLASTQQNKSQEN